MTAGYSGTPLPQKLGIKAGSRVLLVAAPADFVLDPMPPAVIVHRRRSSGSYGVVLLFCLQARILHQHFGALIEIVEPAGAIWVCWPKKASGVVTDLTENDVRDHGLAGGLVDVKVAALDSTWSGLKFVRRLVDR